MVETELDSLTPQLHFSPTSFCDGMRPIGAKRCWIPFKVSCPNTHQKALNEPPPSARSERTEFAFIS